MHSKSKSPTYLCRGPLQPRNLEIAAFYGILLPVSNQTLAFRDGAPAIRASATCCCLFPEFRGKPVRLTDAIRTEVNDREGSQIVDPGLYIDHLPRRDRGAR